MRLVELERCIAADGGFCIKGRNDKGEYVELELNDGLVEQLYQEIKGYFSGETEEERQLKDLKRLRRRLYSRLKGKLDQEERENIFTSYLLIKQVIEKMEAEARS
ncbi:hypothetical protein CTH_10002 (plasmid) [Carboxydocella thermautotrophica]|nr:hypothetical protein CTH_10002 [Carboxydocella thermautotrophica]